MEYLGLLIELLFLVGGIYLYLFSIGKVNSSDPKLQERANSFRKENGGWLRILSLALMAIMLINVVLHLKDLMT